MNDGVVVHARLSLGTVQTSASRAHPRQRENAAGQGGRWRTKDDRIVDSVSVKETLDNSSAYRSLSPREQRGGE